MSWGDSWGSSPRQNAIRLAAAFYEGRELGGKSETRVSRGDTSRGAYTLGYWYKGHVIAWYTSDQCRAQQILDKLAGKMAYGPDTPLQFRPYSMDKGEARHFQALGLQAEWQYGGDPFLLEGVAFTRGAFGWYSKEDLARMDKWVKPTHVTPVRRQPIINPTLPLFA